jgi:hypothetical protein
MNTAACGRCVRDARTAARGVVLVLAGLGGACDLFRSSIPAPNGHERTLFVVLLDQSASVRADRPIYENAVRDLLQIVREGDRFVMAPITESSGADFRISIDHTLPPPFRAQTWLEEPVRYRRELQQHERQVQEARERLIREAGELITRDANAARTAIFESVRVVAPLMTADDRRDVLVVLSDMLEDSNAADFEARPPDDRFTEREIARQRAAHVLPALTGVTVCAAGVVSSPPERAASVERFWRAYFAAAGARVADGAFARTLTSCRAP